MMEGIPIYREEQAVRPTWLRVLALLTFLFQVGVTGYGVVMQVLLGHPLSSPPLPNALLVVTFVMGTLVTGLFTALVVGTRLITEVRLDGVYVRLQPLHKQFIRVSLEQLEVCQAVTFRPWGNERWGIRASRTAATLHLGGRRGVRFELDDGRRIVVGSERPDELTDAVEAAAQRR